MKSILDPSFRYVPSTQTDIRKTFNRVRRELAKTQAAKATPVAAARAAPAAASRGMPLAGDQRWVLH